MTLYGQAISGVHQFHVRGLKGGTSTCNSRLLWNWIGIPAGMELFPAADEGHSLQFIKRVIDDWRLLPFDHRRSLRVNDPAAGVSLLPKREYDHAIGRGVKVIALLHEKPDEIAHSANLKGIRR